MPGDVALGVVQHVVGDRAADLGLDRKEPGRLREDAGNLGKAFLVGVEGPQVFKPQHQPQQHHQPQQVQYSYHGKPYYKKRKSFLSELFDD